MTATNEIAIRSIDDVARISGQLVVSGYFKDIQNPGQAMAKILAGIELGISPMAAVSGIHIVEGKAALGSGLVASQIQRSGKFRYRIVTLDETKCELLFQELEDGKWVDLNPNSVFTFEDAKKAELTGKKNWSRYRKAMLFARALTQGARMHTPSVFGGPVYTPEELNPNSDASLTIDVAAEVVNESKTETEQPEQPAAQQQTPPTATKELPTPTQAKELAELMRSLALTKDERDKMQKAAGEYDQTAAAKVIASLKKLIAERTQAGVTAGQREYANSLIAGAPRLFTSDEIKAITVAIDNAANFNEANEKIARLQMEINKRRQAKEKATQEVKEKKKADKEASKKQAEPAGVEDAQVIDDAPDGPTDDVEEKQITDELPF